MRKFARVLKAQMFFASPVFGPGDRVEPPDDGGGMPAELVGKSPAEIARYYSQREAALRAELTPRNTPDPPPVTPPAAPTNAEFWNDPNNSINRVITAKALSRDEFNATAAAIRPSLIWAAREQCKQAHKDFDRVAADIQKVIDKVPEWQRTDVNMWETAYIYAKGSSYERLSTEDRVRPPSAEPVNAGAGGAPPPDADLATVTLPGLKSNQTAAHVAEGMGISHDSYRKASKELEGDGRLPLTYDNRRSR